MRKRKRVIVMNYPKDIKAFYMRINDDGRTVAAIDVVAPGIGEIDSTRETPPCTSPPLPRLSCGRCLGIWTDLALMILCVSWFTHTSGEEC
jgi:tRNA synthetases class II (D, K and N)